MEAVATLKDIGSAQGEWNDIGAWGRSVRIRAAMNLAGLRPGSLAERLGVSDTTVQAWIVGDKDADYSRWISVAAALGFDEFWKPPTAALAHAEAEIDVLRPGLRHAPKLPVRVKQSKPKREGATRAPKKARPQ